MANTQTITGLILEPNGEPWDGFKIEFTLQPTTYTEGASLPEKKLSVTTGPNGMFSVDLVAGVQYFVDYPDIHVTSGSSTRFPPGSRFAIVTPAGPGTTTLSELQTAGNLPTANPSAITLIAAAVDPVAASLAVLSADVSDLASVQLGRVHLVISSNEAFTLGLLLVDLDGTSTDLTSYACTFSIWANGDAAGTPVIVLTEGAGVTIGAGTLPEGAYNVLIEIDEAMVTALPDFGLGTYALVGDNGVDWPRTLASFTVEVI